MRDVRNRLLITALLLAMASCPGTTGRAEASGWFQRPVSVALKPGAGTNTGDPDAGGDSGKTHPQSDEDVTGIILRSPSTPHWLYLLGFYLVGLGL